MIWLAGLSVAGLVAGFLLLWRVPVCSKEQAIGNLPISFIIPARNEAHNLPSLLRSLGDIQTSPHEVIVIDDGSTDGTGEIARGFGACVISPPPLPAGWTGKNWACHQGASVAEKRLLFFLDADTQLTPNSYSRLLPLAERMDADRFVLSILPFHRTEQWYEELSLFPHILMAMGAGGFGVLDRPHLFGPSLLISRSAYEACGGHAQVRSHVLENLAMANRLSDAGYSCRAIGGRGVLWTRMFPEGFRQMQESWLKAFASGAAQTSPRVLVLSVVWLSTTIGALEGLCFIGHWLFAVLYLCFVSQIAYFARQLGSYRLLTSLLYPVGLIFYFTLFVVSLTRRLRRRRPTWRGREV